MIEKPPRLHRVGGGDFSWNGFERCWFSHKSLGNSPLHFFTVNKHCTADGHLCLAVACSLGTYRCPQRWGCQGKGASKSAGEHYISHYLRTIGHFLLAAGLRCWSGAAKLQEGSTDYKRGGSLCEVDELLGRWFQNGCKLSCPGSSRRWFLGMRRNTHANWRFDFFFPLEPCWGLEKIIAANVLIQ